MPQWNHLLKILVFKKPNLSLIEKDTPLKRRANFESLIYLHIQNGFCWNLVFEWKHVVLLSRC